MCVHYVSLLEKYQNKVIAYVVIIISFIIAGRSQIMDYNKINCYLSPSPARVKQVSVRYCRISIRSVRNEGDTPGYGTN